MNHPHLALGQEVIFITSDKESHNAKITAVYDDNSARVEWENGIGIGPCSDREGIPGTFHFEQASPKVEPKHEAKNKKE